MYGEKIKSKRKAMGLSQEDLAEKLGVTRQAVSKWEMDRAQPTMTNLRELARVFSVDMAYFIGDDEKEEAENTPPVKNLLWWMLNCGIFSLLLLRFRRDFSPRQSQGLALLACNDLYARGHRRFPPSL